MLFGGQPVKLSCSGSLETSADGRSAHWDLCHEGHCYHFHRSLFLLTWINATSECEEKTGHLVSINSEEESKMIYEWLKTIQLEWYKGE